MRTSQEGLNDITTQNRDDREHRSRYLNHELNRSNLDVIFERMKEKGITYQELARMTGKKGDALFSSIVRGKILDFESLKNLIDPEKIRYVFLNGSGKQISIFVQHQMAPYFGVRRSTGEFLVRTTEFGWTLTGVFSKK